MKSKTKKIVIIEKLNASGKKCSFAKVLKISLKLLYAFRIKHEVCHRTFLLNCY